MASNIIDLNNGTLKVSKAYLMDRYMKGAIIPQDLFWECIDKVGYIILPKYRLEEMENNRIARIEKDKQLANCAELNNKGIAYEKSGNIDAAIRVYEQNIASNSPYPATHSFERLMILYRKRSDYINEIRVIKKAIRIFPNEVKFQERLKKAEFLNNKRKSITCSLSNTETKSKDKYNSDYWL